MKVSRVFTLIPVGLVALAVARPVGAQNKSSGAIAGKVSFKGTAPRRKPIAMTGDCETHAGKLDEAVVVGGKGGLAGVHVRVQSGTAGTHAAPTTPVMIDQKECMYTPRVIGAMVGQEVWISNADPTLHNVHAYAGKKTLFNRPQPSGTKPIKHKKLGKAGDVFTLKCDVHKWMAAFVPITDHPFFAVTGDDGTFEISGLAKGTEITLEAWHPTLGLQTRTVKAGDRKITFEFR
jgi:plastocyanin